MAGHRALSEPSVVMLGLHSHSSADPRSLQFAATNRAPNHLHVQTRPQRYIVRRKKHISCLDVHSCHVHSLLSSLSTALLSDISMYRRNRAEHAALPRLEGMNQ